MLLSCYAGRVALHSLDDVGHIDAVGHDSAHVVFHQLGVDAGFLQFFGVGVLFQNLFSDDAMFDVDLGVEFLKL